MRPANGSQLNNGDKLDGRKVACCRDGIQNAEIFPRDYRTTGQGSLARLRIPSMTQSGLISV